VSVKYRIRAPDGATYDVEAPDGTTEEQALARVRQQVEAQQPQQAEAPEPPLPDVREPEQATMGETAVDMARSVPGGLVKGVAGIGGMRRDVADLAESGVRYVAEDVLGLPAPDPRFLAQQEIVKGLTLGPTSSQMAESAAHPFGGYYRPQTTGGQYAETIASFAPASALPGGMATRIARAAVPGAASEAAGQATAGTEYEPYARASGALVGGGITSISRPIASITGRVANRAREAVGFGERNPTRAAERILREAAASGRGGAAAVRRSIGEHDAAGITPSLIDVTGGQVRRTVRAAAGGMEGEAQDLATDYASRIRSDLPYRGEIQARKLTPADQRTPAQATEEITAARDTRAATEYGPAYAQPVTIDEPTLQALSGTHGRAAIARALSAAEARLDRQQADELRALLSATPPSEVSAGTLHRVQIAMRERAKTAMIRGARDIGSGLEGRTSTLRGTLEQSPELGPANAAYRAGSAEIDAVELGTQGPRLPSSDYTAQLSRLATASPGARGAAQVGYRGSIVDTMRGQRAGQIGAMEELASSPEQTTNLAATFGAQARQFQNNLRLEIQRARRASGVQSESGSQTALRGADAEILDTVQSARGGIIALAINWLRKGGATMTPAMRAEIVRLGISESDLRRIAARIPARTPTVQALASMVVQSQANAANRMELAR
jgi:hypothetical protein